MVVGARIPRTADSPSSAQPLQPRVSPSSRRHAVTRKIKWDAALSAIVDQGRTEFRQGSRNSPPACRHLLQPNSHSSCRWTTSVRMFLSTRVSTEVPASILTAIQRGRTFISRKRIWRCVLNAVVQIGTGRDRATRSSWACGQTMTWPNSAPPIHAPASSPAQAGSSQQTGGFHRRTILRRWEPPPAALQSETVRARTQGRVLRPDDASALRRNGGRSISTSDHFGQRFGVTD
jgi:hypothetical protein